MIEKGFDKTAVRIDWDKREVKLRGKKIADVDTDGNMQGYHEGADIQKDVEAHMANWWKARDSGA